MEKRVGHEPNNVVIDKIKTAFLIIPKSGNKSFKTLLVDMKYGDKSKHLWGFKYSWLEDIPNDYLKISMIRDPYSRLASLYQDKIRGRLKSKLLKAYGFKSNMRFLDFCRLVSKLENEKGDNLNVHLKSQYYFVHDKNGKCKADIIVELGNKEDWDFLKELFKLHCGKTLKDLLHTHKTKGRRGDDWYYCDESRSLIWNRYRKDFELLNTVRKNREKVRMVGEYNKSESV